MANRCFRCHEEEESVDRILIHYDKTRVIWHLLFSLFGVSWVSPSLVRELLSSWHRSFMGKKRKKVWRATPLCLFWTICKERNRRVFDNKELYVQGIKLTFLSNLWTWSNLFIVPGSSSIVDFVDWLEARRGALFFVSPTFRFGDAVRRPLYTSSVNFEALFWHLSS